MYKYNFIYACVAEYCAYVAKSKRKLKKQKRRKNKNATN